MIPARFAPLLFALLLSGAMSLLLSALSSARLLGLGEPFLQSWLRSWPLAWLFAFPSVLLLAPLIRRLVQRLTLRH